MYILFKYKHILYNPSSAKIYYIQIYKINMFNFKYD